VYIVSYRHLTSMIGQIGHGHHISDSDDFRSKVVGSLNLVRQVAPTAQEP